MRTSREQAFGLIYKVGEIARKKAEELQKQGVKTEAQLVLSESLWRIQKRLSFRDITPAEAVRAVYELVECSGLLVGADVKNLLRTVVV